MRKNPKTKRADAERAAEHYACEVLGCLKTRRAIRAKWQRVDFWSCDVVGKDESGAHHYVQVTAGQDQAVNERRRKLEKEIWHCSDIVQLLQLRSTEDPANARRRLWFFRVHEYRLQKRRVGHRFHRAWETKPEAVKVPREWFKARKG